MHSGFRSLPRAATCGHDCGCFAAFSTTPHRARGCTHTLPRRDSLLRMDTTYYRGLRSPYHGFLLWKDGTAPSPYKLLTRMSPTSPAYRPYLSTMFIQLTPYAAMFMAFFCRAATLPVLRRRDALSLADAFFTYAAPLHTTIFYRSAARTIFFGRISCLHRLPPYLPATTYGLVSCSVLTCPQFGSRYLGVSDAPPGTHHPFD